MNAVMNTIDEMNTTTRLVMKALQLGKDRMTVKEVAQAAGIKESAVEMMLADAVDEKMLARTRHADGQIAYTPVKSQATRTVEPGDREKARAALQPVGPVAPASVAKRRGRAPGERPAPLPEFDINTARVTLKPLADGRQRLPKETKWGPLFDKLASFTPSGTQLPTIEIPKIYGKAIQAAARKYTKDTGVKLKVAIGLSLCTIQRLE